MEHPYSGVAVVVRQRAPLRGPVGVFQNNDIGGAVGEFWALVEMEFRYLRSTVSV